MRDVSKDVALLMIQNVLVLGAGSAGLIARPLTQAKFPELEVRIVAAVRKSAPSASVKGPRRIFRGTFSTF